MSQPDGVGQGSLFKNVADHYLDCRKKFAVWGASQTMKPTDLGK